MATAGKVAVIALAVALLGIGINILLKRPDMESRAKTFWGALGTLFIMIGGSILLILLLGFLGVGIRSPFFLENGQAEEKRATRGWEKYPLTIVRDRMFQGETVVLDGREFINCKFDDVTFEYNGTAPTRLTKSYIARRGDGVRMVQFRSSNPIVKQTQGLLAMLHIAQGIDPKYIEQFEVPITDYEVPDRR
jgi:hypothetical protein